MAKVVFLDVDGVLNNRAFFDTHPNLENLEEQIDSNAVSLLNEIVNRTGAKVVVCSSWRVMGVPWLQAALQEKGFIGEVVATTTADLVSVQQEILTFLDEKPYLDQMSEIQEWVAILGTIAKVPDEFPADTALRFWLTQGKGLDMDGMHFAVETLVFGLALCLGCERQRVATASNLCANCSGSTASGVRFKNSVKPLDPSAREAVRKSVLALAAGTPEAMREGLQNVLLTLSPALASMVETDADAAASLVKSWG